MASPFEEEREVNKVTLAFLAGEWSFPQDLHGARRLTDITGSKPFLITYQSH